MSTFPVHMGGSMLRAFAEAQIDNRADSRAVADAATEIEVGAKRMEQLHRDRASQEMQTQLAASAVQSGVSAAKSVASNAQKTGDAMAKNDAVGRLESAQAADQAGGGGHRALAEVQINEEQTLGERFDEAQIAAVVEGDFDTPETLEAREGLDEASADREAVERLEAMGFTEGEARALIEAKDSGGTITSEEAAEFFYANRFEPGSALARQHASDMQTRRVGNQMLELLSTTAKGTAEGRGHRATDAQREGQRVGLAAELADSAEATARAVAAEDARMFRGALAAIRVQSDFEA